MSGTPAGGRAAAKTNKERHGDDFYQKIGKLSNPAWERKGRKPRGFAANRELAVRAGRLGGKKSKRIRKHQSEAQS